MATNLEVDAFEIDIETLSNADNRSRNVFRVEDSKQILAEEVIKNLTQESKKRFEEYQEQNDPCR